MSLLEGPSDSSELELFLSMIGVSLLSNA